MTKRLGHGEGSIRQRADGTWEARVSLPTGKRPSFYGKTRKEVQDKLHAALRDTDAGLDLVAGRKTLAQFLDRWLSASIKPSVKTKTYEGYESIVRVRVVPRIGRKHLGRVTPLDLQSLYTELAETGLSNRSICHTHRVLNRAFTQAMRWGLLARNPCDGVTPPRPARHEMRVLTQA
jgi:Phage integrase, N-terminal SAM-like domain